MATQMVKRASDVRTVEIDLSQYITSNSTTLPATVIISGKGRGTPKRFTSAEDFIAEYGNPNPAVSMTIQSALNYFTEGSDLWAVRALPADDSSLIGALLVYSRDNGNAADPEIRVMPVGVLDPDTYDMEDSLTSDDTAIALIYAGHGPGSYSENIGIELSTPTRLVDEVTTAAAAQAAAVTIPTDTVWAVTAITPNGETVARVSDPLSAPSSLAIEVAWDRVPNATGYKIYRGLDGPTEILGLVTAVGPFVSSFTDYGNVTPDTDFEAPTSNPDTPYFTVRAFEEDGNQILVDESFNCTLWPQLDDTGVQMQMDERINLFSSLIQVRMAPGLEGFDLSYFNYAPTTVTYFEDGDSGTAPTSYDVARAYEEFVKREPYKINLLINGGIADPITHRAMISVAERRGDTVALLDLPAAFQRWDKAIEYRNVILNANSSYAAIFGPDLLQADNINGRQVYNPPSGWAAALCARTDRVANQAFSIAGLNRGLVNVLRQRHLFDDGKASALFQTQVNYFRTITGQGTALWEQQTLTGKTSALQWLSVRRIVNVIKVALYDYLLYALQEMNSDSLKRSITNTLDSYLTTLVQSQAISSGGVDMSGNTAQTFNAGVLVIRVILVPMIPVHEIQLQIVISKAGVSFDEVVNSLNGN